MGLGCQGGWLGTCLWGCLDKFALFLIALLGIVTFKFAQVGGV